jgi:hypothetical protein
MALRALGKAPIAAGVLAVAVITGGTAYAMTRPAQPSVRQPDVVASVADVTKGSPPVYLEADLNGRNEQTRSTHVGDPRGTATELLRIKGNQITFEITWQNLGAPTAARIHAGAAGMTGNAVIPMVTAPMSDTLTAVAGSITVNNAGVLARLATSPSQFYLDMGNAQYPGGAVRGQFRRIAPVDFQRIMHVGPFAALNSGDQEAAAGDNDARATAFLGFGATSINYAVSWTGLNSPTSFTINQGAVGMNGGRAATLFLAPHGLVPAINAVAGAVMNVPAKTVAAMKADPAMFYTNLTTAKFPLGAARGQLFLAPPTTTTMPTPTTMPTMPTTPAKPTTTAPVKPTTTMPTRPTMPTQPTQPTQPVMTSPSAPAPPHW